MTALRQILAIEFFVNYSNAVCGKSIAINTTYFNASFKFFLKIFFQKQGPKPKNNQQSTFKTNDKDWKWAYYTDSVLKT